MKSILREMKERFHEIEDAYCDACDRPMDKCVCNEDELEEQNVTGAIAGFEIPGAFTTPEAFKKKKFKYEQVQNAMDDKYLKIIESYRTFTTANKDVSPDKKVNQTIQEIAKKLQEIDELVKHNARLKTESGVAASSYGARTKNALTKISERLIKISERVRALGE